MVDLLINADISVKKRFQSEIILKKHAKQTERNKKFAAARDSTNG